MKTKLLTLTLASALAASASETFTNITNLWWNGGQSCVLALANARLQSNPNDLAGLLMKASYDFDFADATTLSNSLQRVLDVGRTVTATAFTNAFAMTELDIRGTFATLADETPEEHAADLQKVQGAGHPMAYETELAALDAEGVL